MQRGHSPCCRKPRQSNLDIIFPMNILLKLTTKQAYQNSKKEYAHSRQTKARCETILCSRNGNALTHKLMIPKWTKDHLMGPVLLAVAFIRT